MTASDSSTFTVTIQKNGVVLNTFKRKVIHQESAKKWDGFRVAMHSIRDDVNSFLTEEVKSIKNVLFNMFALRLCCDFQSKVKRVQRGNAVMRKAMMPQKQKGRKNVFKSIK